MGTKVALYGSLIWNHYVISENLKVIEILVNQVLMFSLEILVSKSSIR